MVQAKASGGVRRLRRRWTFADCAFDEANWSLTVAGKAVPIERKPLEVLRQLLVHRGELVSKDELLDVIWPDVTVVEASLATAVRKLRIALGEGDDRPKFIQTVPGVGYRFAADVSVTEADPAAAAPTKTAKPGWMPIWVGAIILALAVAAVLLLPRTAHEPAAEPSPRTFTDAEAKSVLRTLDVHAVETMIAAGWKPSKDFGQEGNGPLTYVLEMCEWDPGHDRQRLMMVARVLIENGAPYATRNVWGDTAYSIARAQRYCGPDHPVARLIRAMCSGGNNAPRDQCMASYELARGEHFPGSRKPKPRRLPPASLPATQRT